METDTLYYGDCLDWMGRWPDRSVDLIYLDPPFKSDTTYNILFGRNGDAGGGGGAISRLRRYLAMGRERDQAVRQARRRERARGAQGRYRPSRDPGAVRDARLRRLLKPTGSIFLHCDPAASHYLKIVMDGIFGPSNFRNEIIWSYRRWPSKARKFQTMHDTLLFYVKSADNRHTWNWPMEPKAAGTPKYKRWNVVDPKTGKLTTREDRSVAAAETNMRDVWNISWLQSQSKERLGYPTQKPRALVDRIVRACSNEGDVVLDPFCGCGTTIDAARRSKRRWIGIDISAFAIDLIRDRRLEDRSIPVRGIPSDMASARKLASERPFDFESWAVTRLTGFAPNTRQRGDGGVDGRGTLAVKPDDFPSRLALAQVKGGKFSVSQFRDFLHVMDRDRAAVGYFVTLEPVKSPAARQQAAMMKSIRIQATRYPRMQLWPISDYFEDRLPPIPPMCDHMTGKPMAQRNLI